jgi:hypothetical protein
MDELEKDLAPEFNNLVIRYASFNIQFIHVNAQSLSAACGKEGGTRNARVFEGMRPTPVSATRSVGKNTMSLTLNIQVHE